MIVRFGYVAMSLLLENSSPSKTMTYANFSKLADREAGLRRLEGIAEQNLHNSLRLLRHSQEYDISVYRFSSKLIPLATHQALADWDAFQALSESFQKIGEYVRRKNMRVSFHPDHFCVFSTPRAEVLASSKQDLEYHVRMLEEMGLDERSKCNIHMGGAYGDKATAAARFVQQFSELPDRIKHRITLENDDKTFNVKETLLAAEEVGVPMVLDIHHHWVNPGDTSEEELIQELWPRILNTWVKEGQRMGLAHLEELPPKIHASSPKSISDPRGHADHVEVGPLFHFLKSISSVTSHLDCMLESKAKDASLLKLMEQFQEESEQNENVRLLNQAAIEIDE